MLPFFFGVLFIGFFFTFFLVWFRFFYRWNGLEKREEFTFYKMKKEGIRKLKETERNHVVAFISVFSCE